MDEEVKRVSSGFIWRLLERFGAQGVTLIVSIALARIISPKIYGNIALVMIFITIMQVFVDSGLGNSLIQKKDSDDTDFSTVFWFNVFFCIALYGILFFAAPFIAFWFKIEEFTSVLRVLGLTIVISGVKNIQQAYVSKRMQFKKFFFSTIGGTICAAIIGILMAIKGYGIWALVAQHIVNVLIDTVILWVTVKWKPKFVFSFSRLKSLYSYGWKILVSSLIDTIYNDIRSLIIGKMYSSEDLAYYNKGNQFPTLLVSNINSSIDSTLFPAMSLVQDDRERIKAITRRSIKVSTFIIFPMMAGLVACASPFVRFVLTDKWIDAIPFLQIISIALAFYPISTANLSAMKAIGRSDLYLKLEICRKSINLIILFIAMWFGPLAIAFSLLMNSLVNSFINSIPNKKLLNYGYLDQIKDISLSFILSFIMGICVYSLNFLNLPSWLLLIIEIPLGFVIYFELSKVCKVDSLVYVSNVAKSYMKRNKKVEAK